MTHYHYCESVEQLPNPHSRLFPQQYNMQILLPLRWRTSENMHITHLRGFYRLVVTFLSQKNSQSANNISMIMTDHLANQKRKGSESTWQPFYAVAAIVIAQVFTGLTNSLQVFRNIDKSFDYIWSFFG